MLIITLIVFGLITLLSAVGVVMWQDFKIKKGVLVVDPEFDGPKHVSLVLHTVLRYLLRRSIHFRKFVVQYMLHVFVRVMYYVDQFSSYLYAKSRDVFVNTAVKNRGTVPHFWNHLKVYKREIEKEKEEKEG